MLLDANIFQPLIDVFAAVLRFFHGLGASWGLSIIMLTVAVRLLLVPLGMRQFHSMQRMAQHMPEMKVMRQKYKDNPQRLQQETMSFYKENNINPFSSCLPLLIQWPFLIGLFWTLRGNLRDDICPRVQTGYRTNYAHIHHLAVSAAGGQTKACGTSSASFLFIHDLTNSPHGVELVILLILYIATSIGSSMIMMMPGTEPSQRRLMLVLPVVFAFITIRFPAGALLYYIVFNLWMVVQQSVFKELIGQEYKHPAGVAIGVPGDGSVSSGGGLRGLLGLSRNKVSDAAGGAPPPDPVPAPKTDRTQRARQQRAARPRLPTTALAEAKPTKGNGAGAGSGATADASESSANGGASSTSRPGTPPPSPRKKKKRSGRRR